MIQLIRSYIHEFSLLIKSFLSRGGGSVFFALIFSRFVSFISQWIALQLIDQKSLGLVLYSYSYLVFLIPIGSWGLNQSFLRYAAIEHDKIKKDKLFNFTLTRGILISISFSTLILIISYFFVAENTELRNYFMIFSYSLVSFFILELFKIYFRLQHRNKLFARLEITYSIFLLIMVTLLSRFFLGSGYALALSFSPLVASIVFLPFIKIRKLTYKKPEVVDFKYWKYGFFAELAGVSNYLLYSIDLILIQRLLNKPELVTVYKYLSLIPFSFLFIPSMIIATDFVRLTENIQNKNAIQNYTKKYWKIFSLVSVFVLILCFVFPKLILSLFFKDLENNVSTFQILMIGTIGVLMWRGLFGNLLSSIGKMNLNFIISTGGLILNFILNSIFIPKFGITGAAITTASIMWLTGIMSYVLFRKYHSKMLKRS